MDRFPHLNDTNFPDVDGVNAWKYKNEFDYSKYDQTQMTIGVCSVPWDVGLIHVGNAQIGGLGNVVDFESKEARDAYIDGLDGYKWETKFRSYHDDGYIEVPLPYDKCVLFNYVYVEYTLLPVDYAEGGKDRFFFFIRSCESLAPSTCKVTILRDTWQTFIYDVDVAYMMLERGHAPMALTSADRYLANPIDNTKYLLADDVTYGDATTNRYTDSAILNAGDMWAVIVMTGSLWSQWGEKDNDTWHTPAQVIGAPVSGQPSVYAYALDPQDLDRLLVYLDVNAPQAVQTIKGVFFVARNLVEVTSTIVTVGGIDTRIIAHKTSDLPLLDLAKSQFGYGPRYENIAKLYTSPYAHLEITDEAGNVNVVKIEDTTGQLSLQLTTSLAYPWLSLDGRLSGIGKGGGSVSFKNVTSHTFDFEGAWYDHLHRWSIPTFAVVQSASKVYDYSTHFDREQRADEIATGYGNSVRSADAAKASADATDNTAYSNAVRSADAAKASADASDNTAYSNAVRSADAAKASADASDNTAYSNAVRSADAAKASADATDNTAYGNAVRSAETAKVNADSAALTTQTNTNNSALVAYNNSLRSAATSEQNIYDSNSAARTDRVNASRTAKDNTENLNQAAKDNQADAVGMAIIHNTNARASAGNKLNIQETKMNADLYWDHASSAVQAALSADLNLATMVQNSLQQGAQAAVSGAQMGAIAGAGLGPAGMAVGALASAGAGLIGSAATTAFAANNYAIVVSNDGEQVEWNYTYMSNKTRAAKNYNRDMSEEELNHQENMMRNNNALSTATTNRSVNASNQAASDTHNTEVENADRDKAVSDSNAGRSKNTSDLNALDEYNNARTNSGNIYNTTTANNQNVETAAKDNALDTRNTSLANNARARSASVTNALDSKNTGLANNTRANTTAKANALDSKNTGLANNTRANTTAKANALAARDTGLANNARANSTAKANALDSRDTALEGIERDIKQAALGAPVQFGEWTDGETSTTRPQGLFANIITQSQDAIEQAGDYFLRFGYAVNRSWDFDGFNKMPHFTYWKASDMWISGNNVPDAYLDEIRFYLLGGVCVWRNPADIGRISIYENI